MFMFFRNFQIPQNCISLYIYMKGRLLDPRLQSLSFSNNNCFSPGHCVIPLWKPTSKSEIYRACHDVHDACTAASGMHSEVETMSCWTGQAHCASDVIPKKVTGCYRYSHGPVKEPVNSASVGSHLVPIKKCVTWNIHLV